LLRREREGNELQASDVLQRSHGGLSNSGGFICQRRDQNLNSLCKTNSTIEKLVN